MSLLTTLAIVFVALLALVVLGLWLLRALARGWIARRLAAQAAAPGQGIAARITLVPTERPWRQPGTEALVEALRAAGFVEIDRYDVPEMHVMRLWGGAHPEDGIAAAVYDHGSVPPFYDLVRVYADYGTSTITTNPVHDPANLPPNCTCIADRTLAPASALVVLREQPARTDAIRVDARNFADVFTELYARSIDHILGKGMPDAKKMREVGQRMAEATGVPMPELDDAQMDLAVQLQRVSRLAALQEAVVDRFAQSGALAPEEWARLRDRVMVVHDLLGREEAAEIARAAADRKGSQALVDAVLARGLPPIDTYEQISERLPPPQRLRLLGEVDHPLYAQVVVANG